VAEEAVRDDQAVECLVAVGVDREGPIQWVDGLTGLLPQQSKPSQLNADFHGRENNQSLQAQGP
jgi:hypothetical protein